MKLLSIVIPTRGREYYCIEAIKDILSYKREDFELVVCDNSDTDQIEDFIKQNPDERVVYQHIHGRINSVLNMDTAMQMATGEYVCMIGDDDTILPTIFEVTEKAKEIGADNVTPINTINFYWPGALDDNGQVSWYNQFNKQWVKKICSEQLYTFLKEGMIPYYNYLPRVYHGLTRNSVLQNIKNKTGHIIGGLSPDMYLSVAVSCLCTSFYVVNEPITVAGACAKSTTAQSNTGGHRGEIKDAPHLWNRGSYEWDCHIPSVYSVETIWTETAIKALSEMGRNELFIHINQGYIFAQLLLNNRQIIGLSLKKIRKTQCYRKRFFVYTNILGYMVWKVYRLIMKKGHLEKIVVNNIADFKGAVSEFSLWTA